MKFNPLYFHTSLNKASQSWREFTLNKIISLKGTYTSANSVRILEVVKTLSLPRKFHIYSFMYVPCKLYEQ